MDGIDFGVRLIDQMSTPAAKAASAVDEMSAALKSARADLGSYQKQLALSKQLGDIAGYRHFSQAVADQNRKVFDLTNSLSALPPEANAVSGSMAAIAGPMGIAVSIAETAGKAFLGFAVALGTATVAAAAFAISASGEKAAMLDMFSALRGGTEAANEMDEAIDKLSVAIGVPGGKIEPLARAYIAMGVDGTEQITRLAQAHLSANAIMGDPAAGQAFDTLTKKIQTAAATGEGLKIPLKGLGSLADAGVRVTDVAAKLGVSTHTLAKQLEEGTVNARKFGDALTDSLIEKGAKPLGRQASTISGQWALLHDNLEKMFEDLTPVVDPFLQQLRSMLSIFDEANPSAQAMKSGITLAMTAIFGVTGDGVMGLKHLLLEFEIAALTTYIAVATRWQTLTGIFHAYTKPWEILLDILYKVEKVLYGIAGKSIAMTASGAFNAISGFTGSLMGGQKETKDAGAGLGEAARDGLAESLDMHSPSRVMQRMGVYTAQGLSRGMDQSSPMVASSARGMSDAVQVGASDYIAPLTSSKASSSGGVTVGQLSVTIEAPDGVTDAVMLTEVALATVLERVALQQGL